jgi:hypothetical protein
MRQALTVSWAGGHKHEESVEWPMYRSFLVLPSGVLDADGHRVASVRLLPGAFLDDARIIARRVADTYYWRDAEALWFLLTDVHPDYAAHEVFVSPPQLPGQPDARITITACSWVSADSIKRLFLQQQRHVLGQRKRQLTIEKLELFKFVETQWERAGIKLPWPELLRLWRRRPSTKRSPSPKDRRQLQRDYSRTRNLLLGRQRKDQ